MTDEQMILCDDLEGNYFEWFKIKGDFSGKNYGKLLLQRPDLQIVLGVYKPELFIK